MAALSRATLMAAFVSLARKTGRSVDRDTVHSRHTTHSRVGGYYSDSKAMHPVASCPGHRHRVPLHGAQHATPLRAASRSAKIPRRTPVRQVWGCRAHISVRFVTFCQVLSPEATSAYPSFSHPSLFPHPRLLHIITFGQFTFLALHQRKPLFHFPFIH